MTLTTTPGAHQVAYLLLNRHLRHELIIFDKDGTLVGSTAPGRPANTVEEQYLLPNVGEICSLLVRMGYRLAVASNQGGVAYGYMSYEEALALVADVAKRIGAEEFLMCPHHPQGTVPEYAVECNCRKPKPGMILTLQCALPADRILFVGDWESDRAAAAAAGVDFMLASDFFGWDREEQEDG